MPRLHDLQTLSFDFPSLAAAYHDGLSPRALVQEVQRRIAIEQDQHIWTYLIPLEQLLEQVVRLEQAAARGTRLPLFGLPFGVKDNIDVAGLPTSAGCASFTYTASRTAQVVARLTAAGAILIGKQNMDQFATGLVGIRSPQGYCRNAFHPEYIPGGSSSGSAVAVSRGHVSFSIGSDTGGSGRVPAALNNIVGLKPTPGRVSSDGFLYCNRSFDVAPVFALTSDDAYSVLASIEGHDPHDIYSVTVPTEKFPAHLPKHFRFGLPGTRHLNFFGDGLAEAQFEQALGRLKALGGEAVEIDFEPFAGAGRLVFNSALIAERWLTYGAAIEADERHVHPAVRQSILAAKRYSAADAFDTLYTLEAYKQQAWRELDKVDLLALPTAATIYRIKDVEADPLTLNTNLGYYTYFANPLRLTAVSVPAGLRPDGLPFGLCLLAKAFEDNRLLPYARAFQESVGGKLGATDHAYRSLATVTGAAA
ncbi:allophanate hydrolase [Herbaspirillum sp. Sphag1AN]|uniref:allophanate hydrolase n=1 Tax=unclassified Herbaspirillum TaxID=2624150 RepID=UPI0016174D33|nr:MULTISPECIES: allophanate hydrolase [unclassified Herbaspirillum]MBB3211854.1 allophanate hydrolase [Herbaspirillum sp. Sphag1AN]MBB3244312.1 allophanate hydrolase [Herbaspirillum sp. Sphag64]